MKFTDIIIENSSVKEAKLYAPAKKAYANPDTGITIQNKSAYHVIKDCALITINYLPLWAFGNYKNPLEELTGKFQRKDVEEFVSSTEKNVMMKQLLLAILDKIGRNINTEKQEINTKDYTESESNDPYGEYGSSVETKITTKKGDEDILEVLCNAFDVK